MTCAYCGASGLTNVVLHEAGCAEAPPHVVALAGRWVEKRGADFFAVAVDGPARRPPEAAPAAPPSREEPAPVGQPPPPPASATRGRRARASPAPDPGSDVGWPD